MKWLLFKILFILYGQMMVLVVKAEYYSAVHKMSQLMDAEVNILEQMETFIRKNEYKLKYLKEKLSEYEREREEALSTGPIYFENPVNKYLLTKRLTTDWERIENIMQYKEGEKTLLQIKNHLINHTEYEGAIDGLLRLQDAYRLNTSDIAQGILKGVQYDAQFEARHCYDIGQRALATNYRRLAHSWLREALKRFTSSLNSESKNELSFTQLEKLDIELALANAKYYLGDVRGANQTYADIQHEYPDRLRVAKLYAQFAEASVNMNSIEVDYSIDHDPLIADIYSAPRHILFKYTCAGLFNQSPAEERDLRCIYMSDTHPFLILAPLKVEVMNDDPLLLVYHDVISDREIDTLKNLTTQLKRAGILSPNGTVVSTLRTSQYMFIEASKHPLLGAIDRRVEQMTTLNMKYAENHQFANYGIGGHYAEHHDYFKAEHMNEKRITFVEMGNRIATVLFYLSDVEQGGGTAFPFLKRLLLPKKGAAVFWYNLHASGETDKRTLHGACPIIVGSKWVQNRWIRENDQSDRRPCELFDDSIYW